MGTQIFVEHVVMKSAGWKRIPVVENYKDVINGKAEQVVIETCYYVHPDLPEQQFHSYDPLHFYADYNEWGYNKSRIDAAGISSLPNVTG